MNMDPFCTKDFAEASVLVAFQIPVAGVRRDRGICFFLFDAIAGGF